MRRQKLFLIILMLMMSAMIRSIDIPPVQAAPAPGMTETFTMSYRTANYNDGYVNTISDAWMWHALR